MGFAKPLAFVPTMGALHAGHMSLIRLAREKTGTDGHVAASVFVNPTQFNEPADFEKYPKTLEKDLVLLEDAGVDLVFAPQTGDIFPAHQLPVLVDVPSLTTVLEGAHRPGHFIGVSRVVLKLFNLVQPDTAVFGMKDFQQLRLIEAMTTGLNLPIDIVRGPTLRDPDGLAMSSRNVRLSLENREKALAISRGLIKAQMAWATGEADTNALIALISRELQGAGIDRIDYVAAVDSETLQPALQAKAGVLFAVACHVGLVRLIDNLLLT